MKLVPQYPLIPLLRIGNLIVFVGAKTQGILFCQLKGVYRGISHLFLWDLKIKPSGMAKPKLKVFEHNGARYMFIDLSLQKQNKKSILTSLKPNNEKMVFVLFNAYGIALLKKNCLCDIDGVRKSI